MQLAAMRVQFAQFACDWQHSGTICMQLAATRLQDKRQADKRCVKGQSFHHNYIFLHWQVHIARHASEYSDDGPWIFGLENALVLRMT
jgi:hypothetical protein